MAHIGANHRNALQGHAQGLRPRVSPARLDQVSVRVITAGHGKAIDAHRKMN